MRDLKVLFLGSGEFAVPVLRALIRETEYDVVGVVTQPDRPVGRKQVLTPTPVKKFIQEQQEPVRIIQPEELGPQEEKILDIARPDLIVVVDYGQLLSSRILNYPEFKTLNVHASLLPSLRGAAPIQVAILQGLEETGVSIMLMDEGLDTGPVLAQEKVSLKGNETTESLTQHLAEVGSDLLLRTIPKWIDGRIEPHEQYHSAVTYARKSGITKSRAEIYLNTDIKKIDRMVRAFVPWPVAWMNISYRGAKKRLRLFKVTVEPQFEESYKKGSFVKKGAKLSLSMPNGRLELVELQLEGMKRGGGKDYLFLADKNIYLAEV